MGGRTGTRHRFRLISDSMADTDTLTRTEESVSLDRPWNVVVHDDPVNLMLYVSYVLMKIFGYDEKKATVLMMQVHNAGRSIVWTGDREKAELYVQQLQIHQLRTTLEKVE
jgi:ATP-dependent Clp protease adaptor protein ClpS